MTPSILIFNVLFNYSTTTESTTAVSAASVSATHVSTTTESVATSFFAVPLPQEQIIAAKTVANTKLKIFFITVLFN